MASAFEHTHVPCTMVVWAICLSYEFNSQHSCRYPILLDVDEVNCLFNILFPFKHVWSFLEKNKEGSSNPTNDCNFIYLLNFTRKYYLKMRQYSLKIIMLWPQQVRVSESFMAPFWMQTWIQPYLLDLTRMTSLHEH